MLVILFDCYNPSLSSYFSDVAADEWYDSYIASAANVGIIEGDNNLAMPNMNISRQDAAVMSVRALKISGTNLNREELNFSDSGAISDYAKESIEYCLGSSVMQGMDDGAFMPVKNMTRAEAAAVICRIIDINSNSVQKEEYMK